MFLSRRRSSQPEGLLSFWAVQLKFIQELIEVLAKIELGGLSENSWS